MSKLRGGDNHYSRQIKSCGKKHWWCKVCRPDIALSISEAKKGRPAHNKGVKTGPRSEQTRKLISEANVRGFINGTRTIPTHFTSTWTRYKKIWFRSTWEAKLAKWLDTKNIKWEYEKQRFQIPSGSYLPDFYLPEKEIYIEVKGKMHPKGMQKIAEFREIYGVKVVLANGDWLKKRGII